MPRLPRDDDGLAVGGGSEQVVHSQPCAVERSVPNPAVHREEERLEIYEMRRNPQQSGWFTRAFSDESDLELLQVAKPSWINREDRLLVPTAKSSRSIRAARIPGGRVQEGATSGYATADHEEIPALFARSSSSLRRASITFGSFDFAAGMFSPPTFL